jgi:tRNA (Thr-GGU) A37 N-methylase
MSAIAYTPIGVVRSPYTSLDGMPLQTVGNPEVEARVELERLVHDVRSDDRYGA